MEECSGWERRASGGLGLEAPALKYRAVSESRTGGFCCSVWFLILDFVEEHEPQVDHSSVCRSSQTIISSRLSRKVI